MKLEHFYYKEYHKKLPHVVKFSGGRSSGALLFSMLENHMLDANRGDVIIFNNTSAEHQKTYEFVIECKRRCEEKYNIPFFLTEFQTYEDCKNGIYDRFATYRLVNDEPFSKDNPNGYHHKGEVFEELISWQMYLPSLMNGRTCTKNMKMNVTYGFLNDWFSEINYIERLGHYGENSRIDLDVLYQKHQKNGGKVPFSIYKDKKEYCLNRPLFRPEQKFSDFTKVNINKSIYLYKKRIEFCSFIGFRADEPLRIEKMKDRINQQYNDNINIAYLRENNEHIYAPLVEFNITQKEVKNFWEKQDFDLNLPYDGSLGNCVYCFMKGVNKLTSIQSSSNELTPQNIDWWIKIEQKYQRDLEAEGRDIVTQEEKPYINFFGVNGKLSYEIIKNKNYFNKLQNNMPCNCTD